MSNQKPDWHKCEIDRSVLRQLARRSDREGLIHFGGYFAILIGLGAALVTVWDTVFAIPVFVLYSALWSFGNATGHEACHGTPFRSTRLNRALLYVSSWMENWEPVTLRWAHAHHHFHTSFVEKDPEYLVPNAVRWRHLLGLLTGWNQVWHYNRELVHLSFGHANPTIRACVPARELPRAFWNARIFLASYLLIVAYAVSVGSWLPVCLLILPRIAGAPVHGLLRITQHGALDTEVLDHRRTTRSMEVNPLLRYFYCNMNYHTEHHMYPMVPFHALPRLHEALKDQMPVPSRGVTGAIGEIMATMKAQKADPSLVWNPMARAVTHSGE